MCVNWGHANNHKSRVLHTSAAAGLFAVLNLFLGEIFADCNNEKHTNGNTPQHCAPRDSNQNIEEMVKLLPRSI